MVEQTGAYFKVDQSTQPKVQLRAFYQQQLKYTLLKLELNQDWLPFFLCRNIDLDP